MSSQNIGIEEARGKLGDLVTAVQQGADIILTRNGKPAARIIRYQEDTMTTTYSTRDEAIQREIIDAIEANRTATADEYDVDAIAAEVLGGYEDGYACQVDEDEFWAVVERHERPTVA